MNPEKDNSGQAFPHGDPTNGGHLGMTLRDYFAAAAMAGMMHDASFDPGRATPEQQSKLAYIEADAMLAEREK